MFSIGNAESSTKSGPSPGQTDTCIGDWHYNREIKDKSAKLVIDMLVDIVSRNANLLLNVPLPSSGVPDAEELKIVDEITRWMAVNSEGIYSTRPWEIFGDGPASKSLPGRGIFNAIACSQGLAGGICTARPFSSWTHFTLPLKPNSSTFLIVTFSTVLFVANGRTSASFSGQPMTNA